jgi:HK97 family phage major capsid protein
MRDFLRKQLEKLLEERGALAGKVDETLKEARSEERDLNDAEKASYDEARTALVEHDKRIEETRANLKQAEDDEAREQRVADVARELGTTGSEERVQVGREPQTYRKGGEHSYFRDLTMVSLNRGGMREAQDRLERNIREVEVETRALTTTDGAGGDFVPPLWMVNEYVQLARAKRPVADRVRNEQLPTGTDSINVPTLATGTAVAEQATQNTAVQNTDATTSSVTANVATLAGQQVVAVQLIEQSPINLDTILLQDLAADYAAKVDLFVLNNNATGKKGLLQQASTNAQTYTQATPAVGGAGGFYSNIAQAVSSVWTGYFGAPDTIAMHPRRWAWMLAASDSSNRPLILPGSNAPMNTVGTMTGNTAQGVVGNIQGLDVVLDSQIPVNLGGGTNQDPVVVFDSQAAILWEGSPHIEAFRETKADQLSVLLRFYRYAAFTAARYPKSISVILGTGLVTPTF